MTAIWEPWTPEIGQHVRILTRPECFYCREDHDVEVGATGVISEINEPPALDLGPAAAAHRFWVLFDDPEIATRTAAGCMESHFAAIELEPITEATEVPADDRRPPRGGDAPTPPARRAGLRTSARARAPVPNLQADTAPARAATTERETPPAEPGGG